MATSSRNVVIKTDELETVTGCVLPKGVVRGRKNPLHFGLASRLKRARKASSLSFDSIAQAAGLTDGNTVLHLERKAGHVPRLDTVERIAHALDLSPGYLAFGAKGVCAPGKQLRADGVAERLRTARLARGFSARALAALADASHTAIGNIERGGTMPTIATIEALAKALAVSPGWLGYGIEPQEPAPRRRASAAAHP